MLTETQIHTQLAQVGAIITDDHFVYTSGRHGSVYVNKDAIYPHVDLISSIAANIALQFDPTQIDAVIAPAIGGVILTQWVAYHLNQKLKALGGNDHEVLAVYAEKHPTQEHAFIIKRGYDKLITDKRVLVLEDIINTAVSVEGAIAAVQEYTQKIFGVGAICNRGGATAEKLGVPMLYAYLDLPLETYAEADCPLCAEGKPVNVQLGHGAKFMQEKNG